MPLVTIPAHDIDTAGLALDAELPTAWLEAELAEAELTAPAPGRVTGRLSRSGDSVVVRGKVKAELTTPCARCLAPAAIHVDTEIALFLKPSPTARRPGAPGHAEAKGSANGKKKSGADEDEYEFSSDEADEDVYDGETVVLDPFLREAILLEIPNFPLCSDACPGIRPAAAEPPAEASAEDKPADPRLAPLGALRAKLEKKNKKE
jgi:uncharacterized protein